MDAAEEQIARIEAEVRTAEARLHTLPALQQAREDIRASAMNWARTLSVTVDSAGVLQDLRIHDSALGSGGARLASDIPSLLQQARADATRQAIAAADEILVDDPEMRRRVVSAHEAEEGRS